MSSHRVRAVDAPPDGEAPGDGETEDGVSVSVAAFDILRRARLQTRRGARRAPISLDSRETDRRAQRRSPRSSRRRPEACLPGHVQGVGVHQIPRPAPPPARADGGRRADEGAGGNGRPVRLPRRCVRALGPHPDRPALTRRRQAAHPAPEADPGRYHPPREHRRGGHVRGERGQAPPSPRGRGRRVGRRGRRSVVVAPLLQEGAPRRRPVHPRRRVRRPRKRREDHVHHARQGEGSEGVELGRGLGPGVRRRHRGVRHGGEWRQRLGRRRRGGGGGGNLGERRRRREEARRRRVARRLRGRLALRQVLQARRIAAGGGAPHASGGCARR